MANLIKFESSKTIEKNRDDLREARSKVIKDAKDKYEKEERRKEEAKKRGEDTWMLASVNHRIIAEEEALKTSKKKRKKEKHKKKKEKRKKKKKKKEAGSSSDSSSDEEEDAQWVEKGEKKKDEDLGSLHGLVKGPKLEREDWMSAPLDLVPTLTRQDLIDKKNKEKQELEEQKRLLEQPGQHAKELNPYWKDGGTGVPEEKSDSKLVTKGTGDSGLSWLRKSYQRCVEQAKEEGRSLEDLAAERWGSLEKIQSMIKEAEKLAGVSHSEEMSKVGRNRFIRPGDSSRSDRERTRSDGYRLKHRRSRSPSPKRHSHSSRNRSTSRERDYMKRSRSRDRNRKSSSREREHRKRSRSKDRKRSNSRDRSRRNRSRSKEKGGSESSGSKERSRRERSRSKERRRTGSKERVSSSVRGRFMKPGELNENGNSSTYRSSKSVSSSAAPAWKKREFLKPIEKEEKLDVEKVKVKKDKTEESKGKRREERKRRKYSDSSSSDSSSSESESSDSDSETEKDQRSRSEEVKVTEKVLTEKEMNALGAKILKAEIMGNKDLAEKLKSQLEAAREARKNLPSGGVSEEKKNEDKEDFVVLTRTDRSGMARPVPESKHERDSHPGKRKKKQKVETHTGKEGERVRYFADDDKFDLKTLVEREKMGTAEDQNAMFSRLAGRAMKTQGDDFQVDDIFLTKANKKQAESVEEERDRARAIMEHKQIASSMEKCHFCFNKVEKHLIVAIGTKVYLSLPSTKSLTEGHCLIVPMQHVASGTTVDEDIWSEIQEHISKSKITMIMKHYGWIDVIKWKCSAQEQFCLEHISESVIALIMKKLWVDRYHQWEVQCTRTLFRKTLTRMFNDRDDDVVFMETSLKLKYFPHMSIECVPIEKEIGDMAPIYFKKAIQETGSEWSDNKKVVDISQKDIRHAVPKGFPYFSVDFGNEGGFAHVIEDERTFPTYFGKEIIGGMIDADHSLWRKPHKENFDAQRKKVLRFSEMWKAYDWTQNLSKSMQSDSSSDSE